jgi:putative ABC transport system ATP-binding protein
LNLIYYQEKTLSSLVKLKNITKKYHTGISEYHALKGIDFHIDRGELVAIIGSSGSGKSTLMNIIGFLDHCTTGQYFFAGDDVSRLDEAMLSTIRNRKIGFVFQSFFLLPRLNALENVILPLFYRGVEKKIAEEKAKYMLEKVGMKNFSKHKPNQLSGGQQQRVAIARALIGDPELILADEPTGALDSKTGGEIMDIFLNLNASENCSIVIVTHDKKVSDICKRVVTLQDGHVLQ